MIEDLFKVGLYRTVLQNDTHSLEAIEKDLTKYYEDNKLTSPKDWRTDMLTTHEVFNPNLEYSDLMKEIAGHVYGFVTEMGYKANQVVCTESWFNYGLKHSYQEYHVHTGHHISGVYYIKVPEHSSDIVFKKPVNMYPMPDTKEDTTIYTAKSRSLTPRAGELILFTADIEHMVEMNKTEEPRISLSFNFNIE